MSKFTVARDVVKQSRYNFLDGVRGLAAVFILTRHTGYYWHFSLYRSYLAVDLFFVLSGFVIAHAYDTRIREGIISVRQFMLIRLVRLYPVFLISVLLCTVTLIGSAYIKNMLDVDHIVEIAAAIVMTLFFLPFPMAGNDNLFPLNGAYWSLFFELFANMLYAMFRRLLTDTVLIVIVILSGLGVIGVACRS